MIVVIDDEIYNPENCKIMCIMNEQDKKNIASMSKDSNCFASFPEGSDMTAIGNWMKRMKDKVSEGLKNALSGKDIPGVSEQQKRH